MESKCLIAPSILSADFGKMGTEIERMERSGADVIHVDVMDGVFVPNITFGMKMVEDIRKHTSLPLDVHLMIVHPEKYALQFAKAGADYVTFHIEALSDPTELLKEIRAVGCKCGIVISPDTDIEAILPYVHLCDMVLVMSVYPGFGGQKFMVDMMSKVERLAEVKKQKGLDYLIEIDGGIAPNTISIAKKAGAEVFVAGSAVFGAEDAKIAIEELKSI